MPGSEGTIQVILLERIERLGQMGDIVAVKAGYARNYLLPQGKALRATKANLEQFETQRTQFETQRTQFATQNLTRRTEAKGRGRVQVIETSSNGRGPPQIPGPRCR